MIDKCKEITLCSVPLSDWAIISTPTALMKKKDFSNDTKRRPTVTVTVINEWPNTIIAN
jgi:hypothetical protein